jgi:hypothetical protein
MAGYVVTGADPTKLEAESVDGEADVPRVARRLHNSSLSERVTTSATRP